jgi:hypothetical protein
VHAPEYLDEGFQNSKKRMLSVEGSGEINQQNAIAQGLVEEVHGSGKIVAASLMSTTISLSVNGSGDMKTDQIQSEKLEAAVHGSGNIRLLAGTASNILLEIVGSGNIISGDVVGGTVSADMSGSGSISIGVMMHLMPVLQEAARYVTKAIHLQHFKINQRLWSKI